MAKEYLNLDINNYFDRAERNEHNKTARYSSSDRFHECPILNCGKRFHRRYTLREHLKTHSGERPYKCPAIGCHSRFSTSGNLSRHRRLHTFRNIVPCHECSSMFSSIAKMTSHLKVHREKPVFICTRHNCGKVLTTSGNLKRHVKIHDKRPSMMFRLEKPEAEAMLDEESYVKLEHFASDDTETTTIISPKARSLITPEEWEVHSKEEMQTTHLTQENNHYMQAVPPPALLPPNFMLETTVPMSGAIKNMTYFPQSWPIPPTDNNTRAYYVPRMTAPDFDSLLWGNNTETRGSSSTLHNEYLQESMTVVPPPTYVEKASLLRVGVPPPDNNYPYMESTWGA